MRYTSMLMMKIVDDVVAIIDMLRDHFAVSTDKKLTQSEQLRLKEVAFLNTRSRDMRKVTSALRVDSRGEDEKCSV